VILTYTLTFSVSKRESLSVSE